MFRRVKDTCWEKGHAKNTNALLAVMELHKPSKENCKACRTVYPCRTAQVIAKELAR